MAKTATLPLGALVLMASCLSVGPEPPRHAGSEVDSIALGSVEKDPRSTCEACHRDEDPPAAPPGSPFEPVLPEHFTVEWTYYNVRAEIPPPYDHAPDTDTKGRGYTLYDWSKRAMVEVYEEVCVNRFPGGHRFPCKFIHVGDTAYFAKHLEGVSAPPSSCCVVLVPPFHVTRPDFISLSMEYQKSMPLDHRDAEWWLLDVHYPSRYFGYGIYRDTGEPAAFWYRVLDGWGQQTYRNFKREKPDAAAFEIPELCRAAPPCRAVRAADR